MIYCSNLLEIHSTVWC